MKHDYICKTCGGHDVFVAAVAAWDVDLQRWELRSTYDEAYCLDCDSVTDIMEKEL